MSVIPPDSTYVKKSLAQTSCESINPGAGVVVSPEGAKNTDTVYTNDKGAKGVLSYNSNNLKYTCIFSDPEQKNGDVQVIRENNTIERSEDNGQKNCDSAFLNERVGLAKFKTFLKGLKFW